jgi:nucleoside-diphosphate-sugar epimerase
MRVLIIGCGYVGLPLGAELLKKGHEVYGLRRTPAAETQLKATGIRPVYGDITKRENLQELVGPFEWIVNTVSADQSGTDEYRRVYLEGTRNLIDWLTPAPPRKYVYTSSTSVYGQTDGQPVKEESPTAPLTDTGRILVETEQLLVRAVQESHFPAIILRVAGIYGPDRGYWFRQFLKGEAKLEGHGDRIINLVHRDDVVGVIIEALEEAHGGSTYNVVDDEPINQLRFFHWLADTLGRSMPPADHNPASRDPKSGWSHKKVLNRKLKMELGYQFKYPTFREGLTVEIQRLEEAGLLDTEVKPG